MTDASATRRMEIASAEGNIVDQFSAEELARLGADVVEDYERDLVDCNDWRERAEAAVKAAAQDKPDKKDYPWTGASNVKYPMLTEAALQFQARAYPAIVKGDEAVSIKIIGRDGQPMATVGGQMAPLAMIQQMDPASLPGPPEPAWQVPPGAKAARAKRVKEYLNAYLFYRMNGWEQDTDQLLLMLPIVGCMFRKVFVKGGEFKIRQVSGLKLVAPMWATDCATAPRLTEIIDDLATYQVKQRMKSNFYRAVEWPSDGDDDEKPRTILEQHRYADLDDDGIAEPYIVTVDRESREVLRLEANFGPDEAQDPDGDIDKTSVYYVKYDFFPNPDGSFYGIGFGHLLTPITEVVDTAINQLIDAGTAQIAGGGFVAAGLRLQSKGQSSVRFRPGEYKTVDCNADQLRAGLVERTFPQSSPVAFQLLDMMLGAAKDLASIKDVITGDASNNGQVGTTLALIEQGLQVFTAIYKRIYRSLKEEFGLLFKCMGKWGGDKMAADYLRVLDDPQADFASDFDGSDMDIRPISDPTSVTKMQKMGRGQFLTQFLGKGILDDQAAMKRILEAADFDDIEELLPKGPPPPDPAMMAKAQRDAAAAEKDSATAHKTKVETMTLAHNAGMEAGAIDGGQGGDIGGGVPGMEGAPGQQMAPAGM